MDRFGPKKKGADITGILSNVESFDVTLSPDDSEFREISRIVGINSTEVRHRGIDAAMNEYDLSYNEAARFTRKIICDKLGIRNEALVYDDWTLVNGLEGRTRKINPEGIGSNSLKFRKAYKMMLKEYKEEIGEFPDKELYYYIRFIDIRSRKGLYIATRKVLEYLEEGYAVQSLSIHLK